MSRLIKLIKIKRKNQGFTLAELLVSVIILLLILTTVTTIFTLNQRVTRKSNSKAELLQNARITADLMAREIRQAKAIVTPLPPDNSNPELVAHKLQFEDGHTESQIQYIKYYLDDHTLKRQIIVYYFEIDSETYVRWNDADPFGPPEEDVLEDKIIGEYFNSIDFYGEKVITIDLTLQKNNEQLRMRSDINPRNT